MVHFSFEDTPMAGLKVIHKTKLEDARGHFSRLFCEDEFEQLGWGDNIVQINHTLTQKKGTVRGLHFQKAPYAEIKIVNCLRGKIFDIAVDLRPESPTFLNWESCELSGENWRSFYIPEGFAHGFQTLTEDVEMLYFHNRAYHPEFEDGFHPQDGELAIKWPLEITELSDRDQKLGSVREFVSMVG
ncbi:MAG: dTDP-4-dehydrorhamnose 3,5-epimerase [Hyphomicrobiales bacterium]|nr:dTDP-4-dehydrorhamnose 3,5-epimerase [Hyphomicrobiales bacterium]